MKKSSCKVLKVHFVLLAVLIVFTAILLTSCGSNQKGITDAKTADAETTEAGTAIAETADVKENTASEKTSTGSGFTSPQAAAEALVNAVAGKDKTRIQELVSDSMWIKSPDAYQISNLSKVLENVDPSFIKYKSTDSSIEGFPNVIICYKTKELINISIKEEKSRFYIENINNTLGIPNDGSINPPSTMPDKVSSTSPDEERIKQDLTGEQFYYRAGSRWIIADKEISEFKIIKRDNTDPDYEFITAEITFTSDASIIKGQLKITYTKAEKGWLFSRIERIRDFDKSLK